MHEQSCAVVLTRLSLGNAQSQRGLLQQKDAEPDLLSQLTGFNTSKLQHAVRPCKLLPSSLIVRHTCAVQACARRIVKITCTRSRIASSRRPRSRRSRTFCRSYGSSGRLACTTRCAVLPRRRWRVRSHAGHSVKISALRSRVASCHRCRSRSRTCCPSSKGSAPLASTMW